MLDSGARFQRTPQKLKRMRLTIASHIQRHLRQPLQGERCRSQRFYRHSVFIWSLTTPRRIQPICLSSSVEAITPPYLLLVEVPGTAPGSKMIIAQRLQNHHRLRDRLNYNLCTGNCKVFGYNAHKRRKNEVPG